MQQHRYKKQVMYTFLINIRNKQLPAHLEIYALITSNNFIYLQIYEDGEMEKKLICWTETTV